ncbi:MAG: hypothetical protein AAB483_01990 [Patescibacteria group bacterium]
MEVRILSPAQMNRLKQLTKLGLVTLASSFVLFATFKIPTAYACSCMQPRPAIFSYFGYDDIFSGRVTEVTWSKPITSSMDPVKVSFEVYKSYKGVHDKKITITTASSEVSCGYEFQKGGEYMVYAYTDNGDLSVSLCSNTSLLSEGQKDILLFNILFFLGPVTPFLIIVLLILFIGYKIYRHPKKEVSP